MKPALLSLITSNQFLGLDNEDPYIYQTFMSFVELLGFKKKMR